MDLVGEGLRLRRKFVCSVGEAMRMQENGTRCTEKFSPIR